MRIISLFILLLLWASTAQAQVGTPVITPTDAQFIEDDHAALDNGIPIITEYILELWTPGSDTTVTSAAVQSPSIPKTVLTPAADGALNHYNLRLSDIPNGWTIPKGPTWVATVLARGPGGSARSAVSNPFTFPLLTRPPHAPTALVFTKK